MSKIDLTAAELREFARLWESDTVSDHEHDIVRKCLGRIMDRIPAISSLSLALADAMEELEVLTRERTELLCRCEPIPTLEAIGQEFIRRGFREAELEADLEAARAVIRDVTDIDSDQIARWNDEYYPVCEEFVPAVRAAWDGKL